MFIAYQSIHTRHGNAYAFESPAPVLHAPDHLDRWAMTQYASESQQAFGSERNEIFRVEY